MSIARQIRQIGDAGTVSLARYDAACRALAEAKSVDDVKDIRNQSEALRAYAKQAKNKQLEVDAAEIRIRAERRLGEMITAQRQTVGLSEGGRPAKTGSQSVPVSLPTLAEVGVDKHLADRARKLAAIPEVEFTEIITDWRGRVELENERVAINLLKSGERHVAKQKASKEVSTPLNIFDELVALWKEADVGVRQDFKAYITGSEAVAKLNPQSSDGERPTAAAGSEHHSADHVSPPVRSRISGSGSASTGGEDVTHAGILKTTDGASQMGQTSLAAREGEKSLRSNPVANVGEGANGAMAAASVDPASRDVDGADRQQPATFGITGEADRDAGNTPTCALTPRDVLTVGTNSQSAAPTAEAAADTPMAPRPSDAAEIFEPGPHSPRLTTGGLHRSSDARPAQNDSAPHAVGQDRGRRVLRSGQSEHQSAGNLQDRNEPVSGAPASVTPFINPACQKPDTCRWAHSQASCSACASAAIKARAA